MNLWSLLLLALHLLGSHAWIAPTPQLTPLAPLFDSRGAAVWVEDVTVYRGPSTILQDIDWVVQPKTKWALVGTNGAGKSTLLQAIVGDISYDGTIETCPGIGYLKQTAVAGSQRSVWDEAKSGMTALIAAQTAMEDAANTGDLEALEKATARYEALGGYQQDAKIARVLKGLGFSNFDILCSELSGGWQMRVGLAKLLLSEPALCLMDEPGNHLDAAAKKWLAQYLMEYESGALILVTHDVELLKSMDHIAEVGAGGLQQYKSCNYDQFVTLKKERAAAAQAEFEKNQEKAAKLQSFVDRFGASATKASAAQSRVKMIQKMKEEGLLDSPAAQIIAERFRPRLSLPKPHKAIGEILLELQDATVGYEGKPLVSNINLAISKDMKLLIRGPNGAGKSTLLHSLRGKLPLLDGSRRENNQLRLGVFTQDLAQELDVTARAVDLVVAYAREVDINVSEEQARGAMGRLGLEGEKALRKVGDLSGGEKARVALAMFSLRASNCYLLDEASNHLDAECVEALGDALREWDVEGGAIVVISHDQNFCDKLEFTHVATVQDGRVKIEQRGAQASDWVINGMGGAAVETVEAALEKKKVDDPKLRKLAYNAPKRIKKLEELVLKAEESIAALEQEMLSIGNDVGALVDLSNKKQALEDKVAEYMTEWEELEEVLLQVAAT